MFKKRLLVEVSSNQELPDEVALRALWDIECVTDAKIVEGWIETSEQKPPICKKVLGLFLPLDKTSCYKDVVWFDRGRWWLTAQASFPEAFITHWMPIPDDPY